MLQENPPHTDQSRWLFTEKSITDTKHGIDFDIEGTQLCHSPVEEALCIWYDGRHIDTVMCSSAVFNSTLYQFEQIQTYIPLFLELKIKDSEGVVWDLVKGSLRNGDDKYDLQSLSFELSEDSYTVSTQSEPLCTLSLMDGESIMRAKRIHHDHKHIKVEPLQRESEVAAPPEDMLDTDIILTTETVTDLPVEKRIAIISAEVAYGMNIFKEWFMTLSDKMGGRNSSIQNTLKDAREEVLEELKEEAKLVGADAVLAIDLDYSEFTGAGRSMLFVVATGTAVKLGKKIRQGNHEANL